MNTRFPILSVVLIFFVTNTFSQKSFLPKKSFFAVKTDLTFLVPNFYPNTLSGRLVLEKGFHKRNSIQLSTGVILANNPKTFDLFLMPEYKYYFRDHDFKGFFTGIYVKDYFGKEKIQTGFGNEYGYVINANYGAGVSFGYQFYLWEHLALEFVIGGGFIYNTTRIDRGTTAPGNSIGIMNDNNKRLMNPDGRFSINIGYKF